MEDRVKWIEHKGKKIIFLDYTNLNSRNKERFFEVLNEAREFILSAGSDLLILVDLRDSYGDSEIMQRMKKDGKDEKHLIHKEAVVGIDGAKEVILRAINLFTKIGITPFKTIDKAKDWLAE